MHFYLPDFKSGSSQLMNSYLLDPKLNLGKSLQIKSPADKQGF